MKRIFGRLLQPTGDKIEANKTEKSPTMKEDLAPLIAELLALKVSF